MKKNLILYGSIGCGKSTMIRNALGDSALEAGGYVTLRAVENGKLIGFDLGPASVLCSVQGLRCVQRFLDFTEKQSRNPEVFSCLGKSLLEEALEKKYAVADEFGGMELLIPEFRTALQNLLLSPVPCIGVIKTKEARDAMIHKMHMGEEYQAAYDEFFSFLQKNPDTEILETTGRYDDIAREKVLSWTHQYVRK